MYLLVNAGEGGEGKGDFPHLLYPLWTVLIWVNFNFRNVVPEKKHHHTQFDSKYKGFKTGDKSLRKGHIVRKGKKKKDDSKWVSSKVHRRARVASASFEHPGLVRG